LLAQLLGACPEESLRNGKEAVEIARKACELTEWKQWRAITALAAALYQDGDSLAAAKYTLQASEMDGIDEKSRAAMKAWVSDYYAQERSKTNVASLFELSAAKSGAVTNTFDLAQIRRSADAGDVESQAHLAHLYFTGTHGCPTNMVEAYKWASLAVGQGNKPAKYLIQELELFMSPGEIARAKANAEAFTKTELAPKVKGAGN
jgi:TPR repeat protein